MDLLIASSNKHKVKEFRVLFSKYPNINLISLSDLNDKDEVVEDGNTFSDNALIKAKYFYGKYHIITISDDSGLVVPSLNGEPGVFSSRYSGLGDEENNKLLLKNLENKTDRSAYYEVSICFYDGNKPEFFIGKCFGKIGFEEKGENGFGYDPLFIYGEKTFSEIPLDEKNKFSHRAIALKQFIAFFEKNYLQNQ